MMLLPIYEGPKEHWQVKLESINRDGLIYLVGRLFGLLGTVSLYAPREMLESWIDSAKDTGKHLAVVRRHWRYEADPDKYIDKLIARSQAARKASKRRKKSRR